VHELTENNQECLDRVKNIISNYREIQEKGELENQWIEAYLHATSFRGISFEDLKKVFDACDKNKLQAQYSLPQRDPCQNLNPFTVFRGCVGDDFRPGMSWTTCLHQAIKYPKHARMKGYYGDDANERCSVWVALVEKSQIYCYLNHYEPEFIVCPEEYWKIDIPQNSFRCDAS